jgi:hypothetical protein
MLTANSTKKISDCLGTCSEFGARQARCYETNDTGQQIARITQNAGRVLKSLLGRQMSVCSICCYDGMTAAADGPIPQHTSPTGS